MSPRVEAIITAQNKSHAAFGEVVKDANVAADAVVASGRRANTGLVTQSNALTAMGKSSAMAANQQRNLVFQLNDVAVSLAGGANPLMVFAQQGSQIATIYGPQEGGLGRAFQETGNLAKGLVGRLGPLAAVAATVAVGFAAMTTEINRNQQQQVSFGDVFTATWQLAAESVLQKLQPIGDWFAGLWDTIAPYIADAAEFLIGSFDLAFRNVVTIWTGLPGSLGDITIQVANAVLGGIESMINGAIGLMNGFIKDANGLLGSVGLSLGEFGQVDFGEVANPFAGMDKALSKQLGQNAQDVLNTDYLDLIGDRARSLAAAGESAAKALGAANDNLKPFDLGLQAANDNAGKLGDTLASTLTDGVMSIWQAFKSGGNVLDAAINQLASFAETLASNALQGFFGSLLGGLKLGGGTPVGYGFGSYGKFANGGDFKVGGAGGTDSQMVSFMATPGEQVSVRTPGQVANGNASAPTFNFYGAPSQPEARPNGSGGFDFIFNEVDRRLSNGTMGKGYATRHGLSTRPRRT